MNYNLQPKDEFQSSPDNIKNHHVVVENPAVRRGIEVALAQMQHSAAAATDPANFNACAASHLRMLGAKDFIAIFLNLAEAYAPAAKIDTTNLSGNIRQLPQVKKNK